MRNNIKNLKVIIKHLLLIKIKNLYNYELRIINNQLIYFLFLKKKINFVRKNVFF
jgi:hypothetical protein